MKRLLTKQEIEYVLKDIDAVHCVEHKISQHIHETIIQQIKRYLVNIQLYDTEIDTLKQEITRQYYSSLVAPGESVGIYTGQSTGERITQLTLNTFHSTGITTGTVVSGVPRLSELLGTNKKLKNVLSVIHMNKRIDDIEELQEMMRDKLVHVTVADIIKYFTLKQNIYRHWYDAWFACYAQRYNVVKNTFTFVIECKINLEIMYVYHIDLERVCSIIMEQYTDLLCIHSPNSLGIIDIWFDSSEITIGKKQYITEQNKIFVYVYEIIIPELKKLTICGLKGIKSIGYKKENDNWYIETQGSNLKKILSLNMVDKSRCVSNDMWEIYHTLGVEATREFLIQEILNVISIDSCINTRHVELLVDVMLYTGNILSISRYGVQRDQSGVLTKCSFEESLDHLLKASVYGEVENMNGISSCIIAGTVSKAGTGICDLIYNDGITNEK